MARLIDANALASRFAALQEGANMRDHVYLMGVLSVIDNATTIDAEPVRHGRWVIKHYNFTFCEYEMVPYDATRMDNPSGTLYCSECNAEALLNGHEEDVPSRYCPNCGAKMDGGTKDG